MKIILTAVSVLILFSGCSKQDAPLQSVTAITGIYRGDSKLWGPSSCIKGESNQLVRVSAIDAKQVTFSYIYQMPTAFVGFPYITAVLTAQKDGVLYFTVVPKTTEEFKVWATDKRTLDGISYNIAFFKDGSLDARMSYYDFKIPQGDQWFDFTGRKEP